MNIKLVRIIILCVTAAVGAWAAAAENVKFINNTPINATIYYGSKHYQLPEAGGTLSVPYVQPVKGSVWTPDGYTVMFCSAPGGNCSTCACFEDDISAPCYQFLFSDGKLAFQSCE